MSLIQVIFSIHLFTAAPEFCIIMRLRFFQMLKIEDTPEMTLKELIIYIGSYVLCLVLYMSNIKLVTVIEINGSIVGFLFVFLIPIGVHWKCRFFSHYDD